MDRLSWIIWVGHVKVVSNILLTDSRGRFEEQKLRRPWNRAKSERHHPADFGDGERGLEPKNARNEVW